MAVRFGRRSGSIRLRMKPRSFSGHSSFGHHAAPSTSGGATRSPWHVGQDAPTGTLPSGTCFTTAAGGSGSFTLGHGARLGLTVGFPDDFHETMRSRPPRRRHLRRGLVLEADEAGDAVPLDGKV